jgi:hypothetical protein|nr:MAG TPA: DNA polymerase [Caudoviricetes sp.]
MDFEIKQKLRYSTLKEGNSYTREELEREIERLERLQVDTNNENMALKIYVNSVYGAIGFFKFFNYNRDVASSVTSISRALIKYTIDDIFNHYFKELWHKDTELHEKLIEAGYTFKEDPKPVTYNAVKYADTDSVMFTVDPILDSLDVDKRVDDVIIKVTLLCWQNRFKKYVEDKLDDFVASYGGIKNKQDGSKSFKLSLEQINKACFWTGKKHYIKDPIWDDGVIKESMSDIQIKGIEANKQSFPEFVRNKIKEMISYVMSTDEIRVQEIHSMLKRIKTEFSVISIDQISEAVRVNGYNKYVINDTTAIEYMDRTPMHIKASINYNYRLHNSNHKFQYTNIKNGTKIQYYLCKDQVGVFGFPVGTIPQEILPPVDTDAQFKKMILNPVNNILSVLGIPEIKPGLIILNPLF